jgi:beta-phosphoglucomutase-like phosphatase (HAD superfamily)
VVLFDLDGVLIRGDTYAKLVRRALQRSWRRRLAMLPALVAAMPMVKVPALRRYVEHPDAPSATEITASAATA